MSHVIEIESAIKNLGSKEFEEFSIWWNGYVMHRTKHETEAKFDAIEKTSGCLGESDGEAFENSVKAAGSDVKDSHDW